MHNPTLTIGMSTYDDFNGVYFTVNSLLLYHDLPPDTEIIILDNNPNGKHSNALKTFSNGIASINYIAYDKKQSTSVRDEIFKRAKGEYTLCIDSHVLFLRGAIDSLLKYYDQNPDTKNIISGPLCFDNQHIAATHMDTVWRDNMYGTWAIQKREDNNPFEIPMMGLGAFSCKTSNWPGFNDNFIGFGGEEGYIHEKIRMSGGKAICIPQFKWIHRFLRPEGTIYRCSYEDRIWNYFIGWLEIKQNPNDQIIKDIYEHFIQTTKNENMVNSILQKAKALYGYV